MRESESEGEGERERWSEGERERGSEGARAGCGGDTPPHRRMCLRFFIHPSRRFE